MPSHLGLLALVAVQVYLPSSTVQKKKHKLVKLKEDSSYSIH